MKKFVSILLALAMILSLNVTAFATTLTIADDAADRSYNGYKLLDLTVGLKPDCGCDAGADHSDGCYNYSYTVNSTYLSILQAETYAHAELGEDKPASASDVTSEQILTYLSSLTSDSGDSYGTLRAAADRIYRNIQTAGIGADAPGLTDTTTIDQGYWLFADVTDLDGENEANSLVVVDTKGLESLTIAPKTGLPTVEKKVKDTNDTTGVTTDWQDAADHDINDTVEFKLTATMPENLAYYKKYAISFHDTMSAGLTLNVSSIKVYAGTEDVTDQFDLPTAAAGTCTVSCDDVLALNGVTVTSATVVVVTYSTTLNENAVIGAAGNPNEVYLEFSNNPYTDGTGITETDQVIVFTYQLTINKTDDEGKPLKGAGFTLSKKNPSGVYVAVGAELTAEDITTFVWKGLDDGEYKLAETTVPDGYNKMDDIVFTISAEHSQTADAPSLISLTSTLGTVQVDEVTRALTGVIEDSIKNKTGIILPETGAGGTMMLITVSTMFVMVAAVFMVTRKKMSVYED